MWPKSMHKLKNSTQGKTLLHLQKQFCKTIDNHVKTLLKTQTIQNRADIVKCISQLKAVKSVDQSKEYLAVELINGKHTDSEVIFIMNNSKLDFIQSVSEQQQKAEKLQMSLQQLSQTLINFEKLIEQSEQPIIESTTLLHSVQGTTIALKCISTHF